MRNLYPSTKIQPKKETPTQSNWNQKETPVKVGEHKALKEAKKWTKSQSWTLLDASSKNASVSLCRFSCCIQHEKFIYGALRLFNVIAEFAFYHWTSQLWFVYFLAIWFHQTFKTTGHMLIWWNFFVSWNVPWIYVL